VAHDPALHQSRLDALLEIVAAECGLSLADLLSRARLGRGSVLISDFAAEPLATI